MRIRGPLLLGLTTLALGRPAFAQKAEADAAFQRGKGLMAKGQTAEACSEFETSMRLEPLSGTLYNLGLCHEALGKVASAWSELKEVAATDKNAARAKDANRRATALEKKLTRMRIVIAAPVDGLVIERDGIEVTALADKDVPVDPARYTFVTKAPGRKTSTRTVDLTRPGTTVEVAIPELAPDDSQASDKPVTPGVPVALDPFALARPQRPLALPSLVFEATAFGRWTTSDAFVTQDPIDAVVMGRGTIARVEVTAVADFHVRYGVGAPESDYRGSVLQYLRLGLAYIINPQFTANVRYEAFNPLGARFKPGDGYGVGAARKYVVSPKVAFAGSGGIRYQSIEADTRDSSGADDTELSLTAGGTVEIAPIPRLTLEAIAELQLNISGTLYRDTVLVVVGAGAYFALNSHMDVFVRLRLPTSDQSGFTETLFGVVRRLP